MFSGLTRFLLPTVGLLAHKTASAATIEDFQAELEIVCSRSTVDFEFEAVPCLDSTTYGVLKGACVGGNLQDFEGDPVSCSDELAFCHECGGIPPKFMCSSTDDKDTACGLFAGANPQCVDGVSGISQNSFCTSSEDFQTIGETCFGDGSDPLVQVNPDLTGSCAALNSAYPFCIADLCAGGRYAICAASMASCAELGFEGVTPTAPAPAAPTPTAPTSTAIAPAPLYAHAVIGITLFMGLLC